MKRSLVDFSEAMSGQLIGADVEFGTVSIDSRTCAAGNLFFAIEGDRFDGHDFLQAAIKQGAVAVVVSKPTELPVPQILVKDTLQALQAAAAAWRRNFSIPIVAVAGSNGKTTTKGMIAAILERRGPCLATKGTLNNHIGVPLTLLGLTERHVSAVIEIGANHPGEVATLARWVRPTIGVVTNAGAEHLEGFGSIEGAARAEGELFEVLSDSAVAVINADDPYAALWQQMNHAGTVLSFGQNPNSDVTLRGEVHRVEVPQPHQEFELVCPQGVATIELRLVGRHNIQNALAASAAASAAGCAVTEIASGLAHIVPVKGRLELKRACSGACIIDDTYNANPSSLDAALSVLSGLDADRWLVLGTMGELGASAVDAHRVAGINARLAGVTRLFAIGELTDEAVRAFGTGAMWFESLDALQAKLRAALHADVTVLIKGSRVNRLERVVESLMHTSTLEA
jgi:UDP-N-acetylmuramoyl-tripeptide--D-alanyl-D-alanine ligase